MKLKRFNKFQPKNKLHLYKAFVLPQLEYARIPTNVFSPTKRLKLQRIQNKALRWINNDRPPFSTTIEDLYSHYKLQPISIRLHNQAYKLFDRLRDLYPEVIDRWEQEGHVSSHRWWSLALVSENAAPPVPIYIYSRNENAE